MTRFFSLSLFKNSPMLCSPTIYIRCFCISSGIFPLYPKLASCFNSASRPIKSIFHPKSRYSNLYHFPNTYPSSLLYSSGILNVPLHPLLLHPFLLLFRYLSPLLTREPLFLSPHHPTPYQKPVKTSKTS